MSSDGDERNRKATYCPTLAYIQFKRVNVLKWFKLFVFPLGPEKVKDLQYILIIQNNMGSSTNGGLDDETAYLRLMFFGATFFE